MFKELMFLHVIVSVIFFIIRSQCNKGQALCETVAVFLLPGFGLLFFLALKIFEFLKLAVEDPSYIYKNFENDCAPLLEHDRQADDILPVQDALLLNDKKIKRKILSDAIKKDILKNNTVLLSAVRDEDTEISHYAVSVVNRKNRDLQEVFYRLQEKIRNAADDIAILKEYADAVDVYLKSSSLDAASRMKLQQEHIAALERILHLDKTDKKYYLMKINCEINMKEYNKAEASCRLFLQKFPQCEEPYLLYCKAAYYLQDHQKIKQGIQGLKDSQIQFSQEALEAIRFWDRGEQNAS